MRKNGKDERRLCVINHWLLGISEPKVKIIGRGEREFYASLEAFEKKFAKRFGGIKRVPGVTPIIGEKGIKYIFDLGKFSEAEFSFITTVREILGREVAVEVVKTASYLNREESYRKLTNRKQ